MKMSLRIPKSFTHYNQRTYGEIKGKQTERKPKQSILSKLGEISQGKKILALLSNFQWNSEKCHICQNSEKFSV